MCATKYLSSRRPEYGPAKSRDALVRTIRRPARAERSFQKRRRPWRPGDHFQSRDKRLRPRCQGRQAFPRDSLFLRLVSSRNRHTGHEGFRFKSAAETSFHTRLNCRASDKKHIQKLTASDDLLWNDQRFARIN